MIHVFKSTNQKNGAEKSIKLLNREKILVAASRAALRQQQIQVVIDKPLGLKLRQSKAPGGGLEVVSSSGNAAKSGVKTGDTVVFTSSFFGDELWPSEKLGFTQSALEACPNPAVIVFVKGPNDTINVKNLSPKPAPRRFGRRLTAEQKALATHICIDCGWIYCESLAFAQQANDFICPQCNAPKKRFARFDADLGKIYGAEGAQLGTVVTVIGGLLGLAVLAYVASTI